MYNDIMIVDNDNNDAKTTKKNEKGKMKFFCFSERISNAKINRTIWCDVMDESYRL